VPPGDDRDTLRVDPLPPPPSPPPGLSRAPREARRRSPWDAAILLLGVNLWVTFLLLPSLYLGKRGLPLPTLAVLVGSPGILLLGVRRRSEALLLALYPVALALGPITLPSLVGINVYTTASFTLVAASFVAYVLGTTLLLGALSAPTAPLETRPLQPAPVDGKWRRRYRMYRLLAVAAAVYPLVLLFVLFFHPAVQEDLARSFPRRHQSALSFFGVLLVLLWVVVFYTEFMSPLRAHVRGDPGLHGELAALRLAARRSKPRLSFYLWVLLALVLSGALVFLAR
jgi:hypothetical protein